MPNVIQPYVNPDTLEHHNTRHLPDGLDPLTGESLFIGQPPLSVAHGGTGYDGDYDNPETVANLRSLFTYGLHFALDPAYGGIPLSDWMGGTDFSCDYQNPETLTKIRTFFTRGMRYTYRLFDGGTPISMELGGTGFSGLIPSAENLPNMRTFFKQGIFFAFAPCDFGAGVSLGTGIPIDCGGTGCTDNTQLETLIGARYLAGYDANCKHAAKHKTGGTDVIAPADIGACASNDTRLTDARTPTAHLDSHKTGGSDAIAPADIGAADASHIHAGYLEASFDDTTNYLTIGTKTFDLSSLVVP